MPAAEHRVADRPADQGQLVAGAAEPLAEVVDQRRDPVQLSGDGALDVDDLQGRRWGVRHGSRV